MLKGQTEVFCFKNSIISEDIFNIFNVFLNLIVYIRKQFWSHQSFRFSELFHISENVSQLFRSGGIPISKHINDHKNPHFLSRL